MHRVFTVLTAVMFLCATPAVHAQIDWDNENGDNDWSNPTNWVGDILPGPAGDAQFDFSVYDVHGTTINLSSNVTVERVSSAGHPPVENPTVWTVSGGGTYTLTLTGGRLSGGWAQRQKNCTIAADIILGATSTDGFELGNGWTKIDGVISDGGNGYGIEINDGNCDTYLLQRNTYSGPTLLDQEPRHLYIEGANGAITNSNLDIATYDATRDVIINNATDANSDRLGDGKTVTFSRCGEFEMQGHGSTAISESVGGLVLVNGEAQVFSHHNGASISTVFSSLSRTGFGQLRVQYVGGTPGTDNNIQCTGIANVNGMLAG